MFEVRREGSGTATTPEWKQATVGTCLSNVQVRNFQVFWGVGRATDHVCTCLRMKIWLSFIFAEKEIMCVPCSVFRPFICSSFLCHSACCTRVTCVKPFLSGKRSTLQPLHPILESSTLCSGQRCPARTTRAQPSSAPSDGRSTMWVSPLAEISSFAMTASPNSRSLFVTPNR